GRWLAYTSSTQEGPANVFAVPFSGAGSRVQISAGGGSNPLWSADGRTLYYIVARAPGSSVMAVDVAGAGALAVGKAREVLRRPDTQGCLPARCYEMSTDGRRFLLREEQKAQQPPPTDLDVVLNDVGPDDGEMKVSLT